MVKEANFGDISIDKQSIGSVIEGLSSKLCQLKCIKVTIGTLKSLDSQSCQALGTFLRKRNISVNISHIADSREILKMFKLLDTNNKGYLFRCEFSKAYHILKLQFSDSRSANTLYEKEQEEIMNETFNRLAIRRIENRDRVYFLDFYDSLTNVKEKHISSSKHDITSIDYPIHFIFDYLIACVLGYYKSDYKPNYQSFVPNEQVQDTHMIELLDDLYNLPQTPKQWSQTLNNNLIKLFYFVLGLRKESQLSMMNKQNVLITILFSRDKIVQILKHYQMYSLETYNETNVIMDDDDDEKDEQKKEIETNKVKKIDGNQDDDPLIDGEIPLSQLLVWFVDKLMIELVSLPSIQELITQECEIVDQHLVQIRDIPDHVKSVNSLQLALILKNYEYFVVLAIKKYEAVKNVIVTMINQHVTSEEEKIELIALFIKEGVDIEFADKIPQMVEDVTREKELLDRCIVSYPAPNKRKLFDISLHILAHPCGLVCALLCFFCCFLFFNQSGFVHY